VTRRDERFRALEAQLARFAAEVTETTAQLKQVEEERDEYRKLVLHLREEVERLRRGLLGQKAERLPKSDAQLSLAILTMAMAGAGGAPEAEALLEEELVAAHTRRKPVRKPPPADLPKVTIEILPPEVEREGVDKFECIGPDSRQVLERRPAATVVVEVVYKKFVRKDRARRGPTQVLIGETRAGYLEHPRGIVAGIGDRRQLDRLHFSWSKGQMSLLSITRITAWVRRKASRAWFSLTPRGSGSELASIVGDACRSRRELIVENAVLRHQINVLRRRIKRLRS
jgi:Transposase C of IS166 homeodomain